MIKSGINYISSMPISEIRNAIEVLKFPGVRCNQEELQQFLTELPSEIQADIHGLINFKPLWNATNITAQANNSSNKWLMQKVRAKHFSTHIGQFEGDGDPIDNFQENLYSMRKLFPEIRLGGENVFSLVNKQGKPNYLTLETTSPQFINFVWEQLDFAVFDIAHAKIAARDHATSFKEYVKALNPEKVEIIHISGGVNQMGFNSDNPNEVDLHIPCTHQDFIELQEVMEIFSNVKMVVSELAYSKSAEGRRIPLKQEDYVREAMALKIAVTGSKKDLNRFFEET